MAEFYDIETATLLEAAFVPQELVHRPGLYVAVAGTPAYALLYSMWPVGMAALAGVHFDPNGQKVITMQVGILGTRVRQANPAIGIGREFFVTALKDYADWQEKWWREAIQNAVDAGADEIALEAEEQPDGTWRISCQDNGGGMSEDVLLNKFLVLGGTTKVGEAGTAGGFGKAKELLVLPWLAWEIHSQYTLARGSGIQYEVAKAQYLKGTRLTVTMASDQHTYDAPAISFLEKSYLPGIKFTVNGQRVRAKLAPGKVIKELAGQAIAYFSPGKIETPKMLIRATGSKFTGSLYMFEQYLGNAVKGHVIIELIGSSVNLLTANRDGIRDWALRQAVQHMANEIAADVKSAVRSKSGMIRKKYVGTGKFDAGQRRIVEANLIAAAGSIPEADTLPEQNIATVVAILEGEWQSKTHAPLGTGQVATSGMNATLVETLLGLKFKGQTQVEAALRQVVWQPDFYLINDREGYRVPRKFTPEAMTPTVLKLIKTWTELCRFVLVQLGCDLPFGVGFTFSDHMAAAYQEENAEHWLLLNPIFEERQLNPEDPQDLNLLYEFAIHEVTHMADGISYHNESFAAALTYNNAKCADGWRKIKKIAGAIKLRKQEEYSDSADASDAFLAKPPQEQEPEQEVDALLKIVKQHGVMTIDELVVNYASDWHMSVADAWSVVKRYLFEGKMHLKYEGAWQSSEDVRKLLHNSKYKDIRNSVITA